MGTKLSFTGDIVSKPRKTACQKWGWDCYDRRSTFTPVIDLSVSPEFLQSQSSKMTRTHFGFDFFYPIIFYFSLPYFLSQIYLMKLAPCISIQQRGKPQPQINRWQTSKSSADRRSLILTFDTRFFMVLTQCHRWMSFLLPSSGRTEKLHSPAQSNAQKWATWLSQYTHHHWPYFFIMYRGKIWHEKEKYAP